MTVAEYMQRKCICGKPRSEHEQHTFDVVVAGAVAKRLHVHIKTPEMPSLADFDAAIARGEAAEVTMKRAMDRFDIELNRCSGFLDEIELVIAQGKHADSTSELTS